MAVMGGTKFVEAASTKKSYQTEWILILEYIILLIAVLLLFKSMFRWMFKTDLSKIICTSIHSSMPETVTEVQMEINTLKHSIVIPIVKVHAPCDSLTVSGTIPLDAMKLKKTCCGIRMRVNWGTVRVTQYVPLAECSKKSRKITVDLPATLKFYDINIEHLRRSLAGNHRIDILIGRDGIFTRHAIGIGSEPLVRLDEYSITYEEDTPKSHKLEGPCLSKSINKGNGLKQPKKTRKNQGIEEDYGSSYESFEEDINLTSIFDSPFYQAQGMSRRGERSTLDRSQPPLEQLMNQQPEPPSSSFAKAEPKKPEEKNPEVEYEVNGIIKVPFYNQKKTTQARKSATMK